MCDLWLAVDYVVSNASVMNLLIISFDRYFCVTKPLSYPARRSTKMAGLMIAVAWVLSFILWAPAILFWQFIVGGRTVPTNECYIQFFSNPVVTFGTAIAAFYLPVAIMIYLYWRISKASRSRVRKDSRKTSGTSLGDGPYHSQEEGYASQNNCISTREAHEQAEDAEEKDPQQNGSWPCKEEQTDPGESTVDRMHASTSKDTTVPVSSEIDVDGGNKTSEAQPPSPKNSAADRQSLVTRTLFKVNLIAWIGVDGPKRIKSKDPLKFHPAPEEIVSLFSRTIRNISLKFDSDTDFPFRLYFNILSNLSI